MKYTPIIVVAIAMVISVACATDGTITVDASKIILADNGKPVRNAKGLPDNFPGCKPNAACYMCVDSSDPVSSSDACPALTIGAAIREAFAGADQRELSGGQKIARSDLADRFKGDGKVKLSGAEITVIDDVVGKYFNSGNVVKQIIRAVDPSFKVPDIK
jgi:hypothetical protein